MILEIKSLFRNISLPSLYIWLRRIEAYPSFIKDYYQFKSLSSNKQRSFQLRRSDIYLSQTKPEFHIDISSTLYFCSIVSAFIPIKFYDYRPVKLNLEKLYTGSADLLSLPFEEGSVNSLSCMHVVEHIGLGRYGDPLDPDGDLKAISELIRVLAPDGNLLLVVPVGKKSRIMFNAHRIYSAIFQS